jgi:LacI family transcriptional regulator
MPDVARLAGVSIKTVSRVVNDEPNVSAATAEKVLAAIETLSFRRNDLARNLRAGTSSATIGLVIEDLSNPFYGAVAHAVEEVARAHGAMVITSSSEEDGGREKELVTALLQRRVDGLLIVPAADDHRYLQTELTMGTAVVFLDRPPAKIKADLVVFDNIGGAARGVQHLLSQGHRRIGLLAPDGTISSVRQRVEGYEQALAEAGLEVDPALLALDCVDPAGAAAATARMLAARNAPTAFFAVNNRMTVGVVRAVWRAGKKTAIVGFDDLELAELLPLPVTVVAGEPAEMGRRGAELLFGRLDGDVSGRTRKIVVPTTLMDRGGALVD